MEDDPEHLSGDNVVEAMEEDEDSVNIVEDTDEDEVEPDSIQTLEIPVNSEEEKDDLEDLGYPDMINPINANWRRDQEVEDPIDLRPSSKPHAQRNGVLIAKSMDILSLNAAIYPLQRREENVNRTTHVFYVDVPDI